MRAYRLALVLIAAAGRGRAAVPAWVTEAGQTVVDQPRNAVVILDDLNITYLTADRTHHRYRAAVRILENSATNQAHCVYPYNPDTSQILRADVWVISPDGRKTHSFHRGDFQDIAVGNHTMWNHNRALVFDGSSQIAAGGTLVCEIETEEPGGILEVNQNFRRNLYTMRKAFEVSPPPGMELVWHASSPALPQPVPGSSPGSLRWQQTAKAPGTQLDRPLNFLINPETIVVRAEMPAQPASWGAMSRTAAGIVEPRLGLNPALKAKAAELTQALPSRWDRIRALTEFVQSQIVYLELTDDTDTVAGMRPHPSAEVLASRFGDCKDKAGLLIALLRCIGEDGRMLLVMSGDPRAINPQWPTLAFNHAIAAIAADDSVPAGWPRIDGGPLGKLVIFDPTDSTTPLGVLTPSDQGGWALLVDSQHGSLVQLPQAEGPDHGGEILADATLSPDGRLNAAVDEHWRGVAAAEVYAVRSANRSGQAAELYAGKLRASIPFVRDVTWKEQWDPAKSVFDVHLEFGADRFGRPLGADLLAFSPEIDSTLKSFPEWKVSAEGVSWLWTGQLHSRVKIKIPPGYKIEELPDNWDRDGATVSSHLHYAAEGGTIVYDSHFSIRPGFYAKARYESIREFILKLREAERRPILLRKADHS